MTRRSTTVLAGTRPPPARVERTQLSQSVCSRLARAIVAGEFKPGQKISEPSLATMLGVSRAPIREALIELELRGLVEFDATGRTRVPVLTPRDVDEIYAVRLMIDPMAASLAAVRPHRGSFAALERIITATRSARTLAAVSRLDAEFHDRIVRMTGNRRLLLCWSVLRDQVGLWIAQMQLRHKAVTRSTRQETADAHQQLLDAIRSGDRKKAAAEAHQHVADWIKLLPQLPGPSATTSSGAS
ncbi:MAG: GntR family transcriptional regulator [Planctomycetes bacterium]|nr:GntR family transcriptional regulator [Planctomycetota bacterium]